MADKTFSSMTLGGQTTRRQEVQFGATVAVAEVVYLNAVTGKYELADADDIIAKARSIGICLVGGILDAWGIIVTEGLVIFGGDTMVKGDSLYLSGTPGKLQLETDLAPGDYTSFLGGAMTTTNFDISIKNFLALL